MRERVWSAAKILLFSLLVWSLQTSLFSSLDLLGTPINLILCSLIVFASYLSLFEVIVASIFFAAFTSMLLYDAQIYWYYPILAIIARFVNPDQISDKFLVAFFYTLFFTTIYEFFNENTLAFYDRLIGGILVNLLTMLVLFIVVRIVFPRSHT